MSRRRIPTDPARNTKAYRQARLYVLERDGYVCQIRGPGCTLVATQADHIQALSEWGHPWDLANLRAACAHCNYSRRHPGKTKGLLRHMGFTYANTTAPYETRL